MQLQVPADIESLINKRLSSGDYKSPEEVLRRALELQDELQDGGLVEEQREAYSAQIEEGYLQAERGELIDAEQARIEILAMKQNWRSTGR